jgi:hypothetical protein
VETASHDDEPAGTGPVADDAEQQRRRAAFGQWNRDKLLSAALQGTYPVDQDGRTVVPEWLAAMLDPPEGDAEE